VYCYRSCLCVCVFATGGRAACVCLFVGLLLTMITRNCVHRSSGSDHLQLIKFWPSHIPGKGVCGGAKTFGSAFLQPSSAQCLRLSAWALFRFVFRRHNIAGAYVGVPRNWGEMGPRYTWDMGHAWLLTNTPPLPAWVTVPNSIAVGKLCCSHPAFQDHSSRSELTRIDRLPMTSC